MPEYPAYGIGYYRPTPAFMAIPEHVCVIRQDQPGGGTPIAICGPSGDEQSEADARLFANAHALTGAVRRWLARCEEGRDLFHASNYAEMRALMDHIDGGGE